MILKEVCIPRITYVSYNLPSTTHRKKTLGIRKITAALQILELEEVLDVDAVAEDAVDVRVVVLMAANMDHRATTVT